MNLLKRLFGEPVPAVEAAEAQSRLKAGQGPYVLDVREPDEYRAGHIPGAALIPLRELAARQAELPRGREILCVCRSGSRSGSAARHLAGSGYKAVNLRGGMLAWERSGLPVKKGAARG